MKDNRDMHPMDDIQNQMMTEKNVTDMNTNHAEEQNMTCDLVARHLMDYSDRAAGRDAAFDADQIFDEQLMAMMDEHAAECEACGELMAQDKLLDELLGEIAAEDARVIAPLEAQAAWRKAIRAEAAVKDETYAREKKVPKERNISGSNIIRLNRWMRGIGSIAAALVVLVAGTWGVRLGQNVPKDDEIGVYVFNEQMTENNISGDREDSTGVLPGGYVTLGTYLQSDGGIDNQPAAQQENDQQTAAATQTQLTAGVQLAKIQPVVLRSAERVIQSQNYDRDVQWLGDLVSEYEAYYEEKSETAAAGEQKGRVSSLVIRVPSDRLDDFLMEMDQLGTTVRTREKAEDVTGRYMDSQSRLDVLKAQKNKLVDMMSGAQGVQDLIAIDAQLTEVVSEMERLEGDLRRWQSQQSYSSVAVAINEVFEQPLTSEASVGERMRAGFSESINWLGDFGQDALVVLVSMLPRLVVWVPAIVLAGVLIWLFTRRKKN